ncbi:RteC domain-containing protein [Tenacibaculum adriaticum]|nr:RteC domain-containing protein [Tenacibaculum adriaticum]
MVLFGESCLYTIAEYFEYIFEIDLGQYLHTFLQIRARKADRENF